MRQKTLLQSEQDVRLVLVGIDGSVQLRAMLACYQTSVMTCGHEIGPELLPVGPQLAELEPSVADHAGVGRSPGHIFVRKIINHPVEIVFEIQSIERDI